MSRRIFIPHPAIPRPPRNGLTARRRAEVGAGAHDPEEEEEAGDGTDHDARDGAAGEGAGVVGVGVVGVAGVGVVGAGDDGECAAVRVGLGLALVEGTCWVKG